MVAQENVWAGLSAESQSYKEEEVTRSHDTACLAFTPKTGTRISLSGVMTV